MTKTLRITFSLKYTYLINSIIYGIKQVPVIKKIIPVSAYQAQWLKVCVTIIAIVWELFAAFFGKLLYIAAMIFLPVMLYEKENSGVVFLHILILLTIIGTVVNTHLFNPTKDKYYAIIQLKMNAKEYALVNYAYAQLKILVGFTVFGLFFGLLSHVAWWQCLLIPFFVMGAKIFVASYTLRDYTKTGKATNENRLSKFIWTGIIGFLAVAYVPPIFDFVIPETVSVVFMITGIVLGALSAYQIIRFESYYEVYHQMLADNDAYMTEVKEKSKTQSRNFISVEKNITSNKKSFEYLNDLFIKRHKKMLWQSSKTITKVVLGAIAVLTAIMLWKSEIKTEVNEVIMTFLPYFTFIMYLINRGTSFSNALFVNCDHSLLTYSFYKQPKNILRLFQIRLRELIKVNLLPAVTIGCGLAFLLYLSGGSENIWNYVILMVSIPCMSIFFSVHYLTLYYLLQPFNAGTEVKSGTYKIVMWITYIICYAMLQVRMKIMIFGVATIVFCILYCIIACILVYKFAPKTFRIHQ